MPRITPIDPYKLVKILGKAGFKPVRRKGSHVILIDDRRVRIVVPIHPGRFLPKDGFKRYICCCEGMGYLILWYSGFLR